MAAVAWHAACSSKFAIWSSASSVIADKRAEEMCVCSIVLSAPLPFTRARLLLAKRQGAIGEKSRLITTYSCAQETPTHAA